MIFSSQDDVSVLCVKTAYFLVDVLKLASHYMIFVAKTEHFEWKIIPCKEAFICVWNNNQGSL